MRTEREPGSDITIKDFSERLHKIPCNRCVRIFRNPNSAPIVADASCARVGDFIVWDERDICGDVICG